MTLIYRALWQDDDAGLIDVVRQQFTAWVTEKYPGIELSGDGTFRWVQGGDRADVVVEAGSGSLDAGRQMAVLRATLVESRGAHAHDSRRGGTRWETKVRAWTFDTGDPHQPTTGWVWVDVSAVGEEIDLRSLSPAAPKLVRTMLGASRVVHNNRIPIHNAVLRFHGTGEGESLAEFITSPDRRLPIAVFADTDEFYRSLPQSAPYTFDDIVTHACNKVVGIGRVAVVDGDAAAAMTAAMGESHGLWGGAFRIYLRDVDPAVSNDAARHRYFLPSRYSHSRSAAGHIIARALSPVSAVQRPPESYDRAKEILDRSIAGDDYEALYNLAIEESELWKQEVIELREQVQLLNVQIDGQAIDAEVMAANLNSARTIADLQARHLDYLKQRLEKLKGTDRFESSGAAYAGIPAAADTASQAVLYARRYLNDCLTIHESAVQKDDLAKLDAANASVATATHTWHGFRALHAYAKSMQENNGADSFWTWCQNSDHPWKWRATQTSLAMRESKSVSDHPDSRTFPIATEVEPAGFIYMDKHLKFDTNGEHAPRIYFHFDSTRCHMHVGFFGPHTRLKNSTN